MPTDQLVLGPLPQIHLGFTQLPTYYVVISAVFCMLAAYAHHRSLQKDLPHRIAMDLFLVIMVCGALGARLLHVFYEAPEHYLENPLRILYFWEGGFVYYGGLLAGWLGGYLYLKKQKQSVPLWMDFVTPLASLGYALGRIACFLEGCCYGKVCEWPWAIPTAQMDLITQQITWVNRHPTQLYAVLAELILFFLVLWSEKKRIFRIPGLLFWSWLGFHAISRFVLEMFRDDDRGALFLSLPISAWISLGLLLLALVQQVRLRSSV